VERLSQLAGTLDSCHSLFLKAISEPQENALSLLVVESFVSPDSESMEIAGARIEGLHRVAPTSESREFELVWNNYVTYIVTNESYAAPENGQSIAGSGRLIQQYEQSDFLIYVGRSTIATAEYPGPLIHLRILCENHVVDVVSTEFPQTNDVGHAGK
jgi:hypothetical protein